MTHYLNEFILKTNTNLFSNKYGECESRERRSSRYDSSLKSCTCHPIFSQKCHRNGNMVEHILYPIIFFCYRTRGDPHAFIYILPVAWFLQVCFGGWCVVISLVVCIPLWFLFLYLVTAFATGAGMRMLWMYLSRSFVVNLSNLKIILNYS